MRSRQQHSTAGQKNSLPPRFLLRALARRSRTSLGLACASCITSHAPAPTARHSSTVNQCEISSRIWCDTPRWMWFCVRLIIWTRVSLGFSEILVNVHSDCTRVTRLCLERYFALAVVLSVVCDPYPQTRWVGGRTRPSLRPGQRRSRVTHAHSLQATQRARTPSTPPTPLPRERLSDSPYSLVPDEILYTPCLGLAGNSPCGMRWVR